MKEIERERERYIYHRLAAKRGEQYGKSEKETRKTTARETACDCIHGLHLRERTKVKRAANHVTRIRRGVRQSRADWPDALPTTSFSRRRERAARVVYVDGGGVSVIRLRALEPFGGARVGRELERVPRRYAWGWRR